MVFNRTPITDRNAFKAYCLRKLGSPTLVINVTDDQLEDCINDTIIFCQDYLQDGNFHMYWSHQLVSDDFTNKYISVPDDILGIKQVFFQPFVVGNSLNNVFRMSAVAMINNLTVPTSYISDYWFSKLNVATLNKNLIPYNPIRFNYATQKLYIDIDWDFYLTGENYICIECFSAIDPETNNRLWNNTYVKRYCVAKIMEQWGRNLSKYTGVKLTGDLSVNADKILSEAKEELDKVKQELENYIGWPGIIVA